MKIEYVVLENISFEEVRGYAELLPAERREKIGRYRFDKDKLLSLAAGLLIRRAAGESPIALGEHGKPYVNNGVFFSVSHSGDTAAIAVAGSEVGLDIEKQPTDESRLKLADRFYHPAERSFVAASDDPCRAFCEIWTRKEAYLKMTGEGISADLRAFDTTSEPLSSMLHTMQLGRYCLSVCCEQPMGERDIHISKLELKELLP